MLWSKYRGKKQTVSLGLVTCFCYFVSSPELHNKYYTFFSFPTQCGYLSLLSSLVTTPSTQPSLSSCLGPPLILEGKLQGSDNITVYVSSKLHQKVSSDLSKGGARNGEAFYSFFLSWGENPLKTSSILWAD
uniref:Uncharacterized protein n=1 Tax=Neolamprologus brichardi TaxID=32507 RepID=A0A3Q4I3Q3_NEOBR